MKSWLTRWLKKSTLKQKVMAAFLILGLAPTTLLSLVGLKVSKDILLNSLFSHLTDAKNAKTQQVTDYFNSQSHTIQALASSLLVQEALTGFRENISSLNQNPDQIPILRQDYRQGFAKIYQEKNPGASLDIEGIFSRQDSVSMALQYYYLADNPYMPGQRHLYNGPKLRGYHQVHQRYHNSFRVILEQLNLYDIFIVDKASSRVVYSVFKEVDFGILLDNGPFADSGLSQAFRQAQELAQENKNRLYTVMTDYQLYRPSYELPASFMAAPIIINKKIEGYLVVQLPLDKLSRIMEATEKLGKTGESYLVGNDGLLRTDTYRHRDTFNVISSFKNPERYSINSSAIKKAMAGQSEAGIFRNYAGESVISAFAPIDIFGQRWVMVVEQGLEEALKPVTKLQLFFIIMLLLSVPLIIAAAWWLTRRQLGPILAMTVLMDNVKKRWDFSLRSNNASLDEVGQACQAFNTLMASLQQVIANLNSTLGSFSDGQFDARISQDMPGDLDTLKQAANATATELEEVISGILHVMSSIQKGNFGQRIDRHTSGQLAELTDKINHTSQKLEFLTEMLLAMADAINNGQLDFRLALSREMTLQGAYEGLETKMNEGLDQLEGVVNTIQHVSSEVGSQITQISAMSASMLQQSSEQAQSSQTIMGNLRQWQEDVKRLVKEAKQSGELVSGALSEADRVSQVIDGAEAAILDIREVSTRIGNVAKGITEVATQTTMLALNAAIEATKAGVEGKGFTVVADEVRVLADQSTRAAKEINTLVEETYNKVDKGVSSVGDVSGSFERLSGVMTRMGNNMAQMEQAILKQEHYSQSILSNIQSIDDSSQTSKAAVETVQIACRDMQHKFTELAQRLSRLKTRRTG